MAAPQSDNMEGHPPFRAAELARNGHLAEAEGILLEWMKGVTPDSRALDLLARIKAQQGDSGEAERLWKKALDLEPGNPVILEGLDHIAKHRRPGWKTPRRLLAPGLTFLLAVLCFFRIDSLLQILQSETETRDAVLIRSLDRVQFELSELKQNQIALKEQLEAPDPLTPGATRLQASAPGIDPSFSFPGVVMNPRGQGWDISFENGLFTRGTRVNKEAPAMLSALGQALVPLGHHIRLEVCGYTDDFPMPPGKKYADNMSLALDRARVAMEYLRSASGFSPVSFALTASSVPLFPKHALKNSLKNRTVALHIHPVAHKEGNHESHR